LVTLERKCCVIKIDLDRDRLHFLCGSGHGSPLILRLDRLQNEQRRNQAQRDCMGMEN